MCSHYEGPTADRIHDAFGIRPEGPVQTDLWPGHRGYYLTSGGDTGGLSVSTGTFGLLPHWAKDGKLARHTYNCRSETAAKKPSFRAAWRQARHCIIPAEAIYEPDWRSGKSIPTRITRRDGGLILIAGLWESWSDAEGVPVNSYTMLTINADQHDLMRHYHRPEDEKRMVVMLASGAIQDWLTAPAGESAAFLRQYPAERLQAEAAG